MGELRGDVVGCDRVVLGPRAKVFGNIETRNLTVAEGAYLDGNVTHDAILRREDRVQRPLIEEGRRSGRDVEARRFARQIAQIVQARAADAIARQHLQLSIRGECIGKIRSTPTP